MSQTAKVPYITRVDIEQWQAFDDRRKALMRQAGDLKKQQDELEDKLMAFVRAQGGAARSVLRSGYRLAIALVKGAVSWKAEYVKAAGTAAAEELAAAAPQREVLSVEKAA